MINQSIKFFTVFLLAFSVFAGGDDRDEEYYETLDAELANFEAQLAEDLANQVALEAFQQKLAEEKAAAAELAAFKAELAAHEECKDALNLSDSNITLFKTALAAGNLFSVGPQITAGTEFTANRWDDYASCIGALGYKNPF